MQAACVAPPAGLLFWPGIAAKHLANRQDCIHSREVLRHTFVRRIQMQGKAENGRDLPSGAMRKGRGGVQAAVRTVGWGGSRGLGVVSMLGLVPTNEDRTCT